MLWNRIRGLNRAYYSALVVGVSGFYWLYLVVFESVLKPGGGLTYERYATYNLAAICALVLRAFNSGSKSQQLLRSDFYSNHRSALRDASAAGVGIFLILVATKDPRISRMFLFSFLPMLYVVLFFCHRFLPTILIRTFFTRVHMQKALLVGPIEKAERIESWSNQMLNLGMDARRFYQGFRSNGDIRDGHNSIIRLERIVRQEQITQVVLLEPMPMCESLSEIVAVCNRQGSRLMLVDTLAEIFNRRVSHFNVSGLDLITVMEEPLEDPFNRLLKRAFDLAISFLVVGLVMPPLALVVAFVQRRQSPGPLFYHQTRAGRANKPFRIIKFRTMYASNDNQARQATANDERIYPFGRWLRKTSLDEIPQFFNVLRGEMSVVGPRPHMIVHNRRFAEIMATYRIRAFIKPGITGIAQVGGHRGEARSDSEILERVKLDIDYIENWSLWQDFLIVLKTFMRVLKPHKTAY
jgi:putative colanic acid biosynthesis UDP-glucose lipid carrier transferase